MNTVILHSRGGAVQVLAANGISPRSRHDLPELSHEDDGQLCLTNRSISYKPRRTHRSATCILTHGPAPPIADIATTVRRGGYQFHPLQGSSITHRPGPLSRFAQLLHSGTVAATPLPNRDGVKPHGATMRNPGSRGKCPMRGPSARVEHCGTASSLTGSRTEPITREWRGS